MNCQEAKQQLPLHLYGDLDPTEDERLRHHLSSCAACRAELMELQRVRETLAVVPPAAVDVNIAEIYERASGAGSLPPTLPLEGRPKSRRFIDSWKCALIVLFGILLPTVSVGIEVGSAMCAKQFFDPIPTMWHTLLAAFVPLANLLALVCIINQWTLHRTSIAMMNGIAIGISLVYALVFAPLMPLAVFATLFAGMGLLPMAPLFAFICGLVIQRQLLSKSGGVASRRAGIILAGSLLGILLIFAAEAPMILTQIGLQMVSSEEPEARTEGLAFLRRFGSEDEVLRLAYGDRRRAVIHVSSIVADPIAPEVARATYYRLTGQPYNAVPPPARTQQGNTFLEFDDREFDVDLGGEAVASRLRGLRMISSRFDGEISPGELWAYVEWTFEFHNQSSQSQEARGQILLPPGGVVSRLTLWVNGEPREAAFAATSQVREAYRQVAVVRRQDPVLVTWAANDRVMMQCFPVPPNGGRMKVRIGFTIPAVADHFAKLRLPCFAERNFSIPMDLSHAVWLEASEKVEVQASSLNVSKDGSKGYALRGTLSEQDLLAFDSAIYWPLTDPISMRHWTRDPVLAGKMILQELVPTPPNSTESIVLVVDGSVGMDAYYEDVAAAIAKFPEPSKLQVFLAADTVIDLSNQIRQWRSQGEKEIAAGIRSRASEGGCDNLPALTTAWDNSVNDNTPVLWIHATQPVMLEPAHPFVQRLERRPKRIVLYDIAVTPGPNRLLEEIKLAGTVTSMGRYSTLRDDLNNLFQRLTGENPNWEVRRSEAEHLDGALADAREGSRHIARLWASDKARQLLQQGNSEDDKAATSLAISHQLVTPVSGAVVLETQRQYDEAGLQPVDPNTVPTVPEPEVWLLLLVVLAAVIYEIRRKRARTVS